MWVSCDGFLLLLALKLMVLSSALEFWNSQVISFLKVPSFYLKLSHVFPGPVQSFKFWIDSNPSSFFIAAECTLSVFSGGTTSFSFFSVSNLDAKNGTTWSSTLQIDCKTLSPGQHLIEKSLTRLTNSCLTFTGFLTSFSLWKKPCLDRSAP